ncbi:MAG: hypothetical protein AAFV32_09090 [Myxococcota bacterium]
MESSLQETEQVSGGYFVVLPAARSPYMNAELLPDEILTVSDCINDMAPHTWAIDWSTDSAESRVEHASKFGIEPGRLAELQRWATQALDDGMIGWPGTLLELDDAVRFVQAYVREPRAVVCGIGLSADLRSSFLEEAKPGQNEGATGVYLAIKRGHSPADGGRSLGFDVLGWEFGAFHSYLCNGLENHFQKEFGIIPNSAGRFDTEAEARTCADCANLEETGAEPGLWLPWEVRVYDSDR